MRERLLEESQFDSITTLKSDLGGVTSNAIKDLSVSFLLPISFEVE